MTDAISTLVIGGGPGGYVAAIHCAQLGQKVTVVEKEAIGGVCLNRGCIPTKALLDSAHVYSAICRAEEYGLHAENASFDWSRMQSRKNGIVEKLKGGIAALFKANGVTLIQGTATFIDNHNVRIHQADAVTEMRPDRIIIACGSKPAVPGFIPKHERVITSTEALNFEQLPKSILILGGGVIGCEFAGLFAELGVKITLVEMLPSLLPMLDKEVGRALGQKFRRMGIDVHCGTPLSDITADENGVRAKIGETAVEADYLLVGIGRAPATESLGLEQTAIACSERGWIQVDKQCRTSIPHIYAIGDIATKWQLAHAASAMGMVAAEAIAGKEVAFDPRAVPGCVFTAPEIGTVGLSAEQAEQAGYEIVCGKFPFAALGKAMTLGETDGFCKYVCDAKTDQVLGIHIVGAHAADLIAEATVVVEKGMTAHELGTIIHAHPTLGEIMNETAHAVHGMAVHIPPPRKR